MAPQRAGGDVTQALSMPNAAKDDGRWARKANASIESRHWRKEIKKERRKTSRSTGRFDGSATQGSQRLLRWPIVLGVTMYALLLLWLYTLTRLSIAVHEFVLQQLNPKRRRLFRKLRAARSYEEWVQVAQKLDEAEHADEWQRRPDSTLYDHRTVESLYERLQQGMDAAKAGRQGYANDLMYTLGVIYNSNLGGLGIDNEAVYAETHVGTKLLIEQLIDSIIRATRLVIEAPQNELTLAEKQRFLHTARRSYGRTALCLSSGAMLANFHFGTAKALLDQGIFPQVVSGTSGGSFVAAFVCIHSDEELFKRVNDSLADIVPKIDDSLWQMLVRYLTHGEMVSTKNSIDSMREIFGDITFLEAYEKTGRILCITATSSKKFGDTILLNYLTAPHVVIWSAVLASSAVPPVFKAMHLYVKNPRTNKVEAFTDFGMCWTDGAFKSDVPQKALSETFNVNYIVVSQVNPHIIPFFFERRGSSGDPSTRRFGSSFRGGFVLSSLEALLRFELIKMLKFVEQFDLLPMLFSTDFSRVFLQRYHGDVTIFPKRGLAMISDLMTVLTTPTKERMAMYILEGMRFTWPKVHRIRNHIVLEQTLRTLKASLPGDSNGGVHANPGDDIDSTESTGQ